MKKYVTAALCALLVLSVPEFSVKTYAADSKTICVFPNPFITCDTLEYAEESAGFDMAPPTVLPEGYTVEGIQAIKGDLIDIRYTNEGNNIIVRKTKGIKDSSGNYLDYTEMTKVVVNDQDIILKSKKGKAYVAVWNDGTYSYSVSINDNSAGLDRSEITNMIREIK